MHAHCDGKQDEHMITSWYIQGQASSWGKLACNTSKLDMVVTHLYTCVL